MLGLCFVKVCVAEGSFGVASKKRNKKAEKFPIDSQRFLAKCVDYQALIINLRARFEGNYYQMEFN